MNINKKILSLVMLAIITVASSFQGLSASGVEGFQIVDTGLTALAGIIVLLIIVIIIVVIRNRRK